MMNAASVWRKCLQVARSLVCLMVVTTHSVLSALEDGVRPTTRNRRRITLERVQSVGETAT
jgi:hypothetical protein